MDDSLRDEKKRDKTPPNYFTKVFWILVSPFGMLCFIAIGVWVYEMKHPAPPKPATFSRSLPPNVERSSGPPEAPGEKDGLVNPTKTPPSMDPRR